MYSMRLELELVYSLFAHGREFLHKIARELKEIINKLRKCGTMAAMLLNETSDERGQGHHQSMTESPPKLLERPRCESL